VGVGGVFDEMVDVFLEIFASKMLGYYDRLPLN
jgi:hypothetical protein